MNDLRVFKNSEFGELGVLLIDDKEYFPATACAKLLGYASPKDAIAAHCKGAVKHRLPTNGGSQDIKFIPEGDLYRLIIRSKLPAAERFERWVFDEVLPAIRRQGGYIPAGQIADIIQQTATAVVSEVVKQILPILLETAPPTERHPSPPRPMLRQSNYLPPSPCKLETFPESLRGEVDTLLDDMMVNQELNFSYIARFCAANGFPISSPAVKTYFKRRFNDC